MTALVLALVLWQDGETLLTDALDKLRDAEGVEIKGSVKREEPGGGAFGFAMGSMMGGGGGGKPFEGEFTARLAEDRAELRGEGKGVRVEAYKRGDKVVKRQTWTREPVNADGFANEVLGALDLARLRKAARDGKFEEVERDGEDRIVRGALGIEALEEVDRDDDGGDEDNPMRHVRRMMRLKLTEAKVAARIDGETGRLKSLSLSLTRELDMGGMGGLRFRMGGEDREDAPRIASTTRFEWSVKGAGADHAPRIPEELERMLEDQR
jgi:hypothetical protein